MGWEFRYIACYIVRITKVEAVGNKLDADRVWFTQVIIQVLETSLSSPRISCLTMLPVVQTLQHRTMGWWNESVVANLGMLFWLIILAGDRRTTKC